MHLENFYAYHMYVHMVLSCRFDSKFQEAVDGMKELNRLISSSEMDQTHGSSPTGSDISVDTINEELEVSECGV